MVTLSGNQSTITLGNGAGDTVSYQGADNIITLGNGNDDMVTLPFGAFTGSDNTITVGNGNDTIYVGSSDTVTVGTGKDSFVFEQRSPGLIGAVTINHFNPSNDVITILSQLTTAVSYHDNSQGSAVITVDTAGTQSPWWACMRLPCIRVISISRDGLQCSARHSITSLAHRPF